MNWIDFRDIPLASAGTSNLFLDYIYDFEKVGQYYAADFRSDDGLKKMMQEVRHRCVERQAVAEVLYEQNKALGCGEKTLSNIELLRQEDTFAVVTGQQVGLFAGPMYTLYKAITAAKLAQEFGGRYPDCRFVPMFWLEGEDHDFDEANNIHLITRDNKLLKMEYLVDGRPTEHNLGAIGELVIGPHMDIMYSQINEILPASEFRDEVLSLAKSFYKPGMTFADAFARFLGFFFEDAGVIFVNSNHPRLKRLLLPVFHKEIAEYSKIRAAGFDECRTGSLLSRTGEGEAYQPFHVLQGGSLSRRANRGRVLTEEHSLQVFKGRVYEDVDGHAGAVQSQRDSQADLSRHTLTHGRICWRTLGSCVLRTDETGV